MSLRIIALLIIFVIVNSGCSFNNTSNNTNEGHNDTNNKGDIGTDDNYTKNTPCENRENLRSIVQYTQGSFAYLDGWMITRSYSKDFSKGTDQPVHMLKIKQDGTKSIKINNDWPLQIDTDGEWIYYASYENTKYLSWENGYDGDVSLYKVKLDGTDKTLLYKSEGESYFLLIGVYNKWIYFKEDANDSILMKVKNDGSLKAEIVLNNDEIHSPVLSEENIYYVSFEEGYVINKINLDNNKNTILLKIVDYIKDELNGLQQIIVKDDFIYILLTTYQGISQEEGIYRFSKTNKTFEKIVSDKMGLRFSMYENKLIYRNVKGELKLFDILSKENELIDIVHADFVAVVNDYLYYLTEEGLIGYNFKTKEKSQIFDIYY